jgi:sugar phosphate isomerase/epimerase
MHPRLSIDAMCTFKWSFEQDLALWRDLGVRHAGLLGNKLADAPEAKMARLDAAGIRASTIIAASFNLSDPASWEATAAEHKAVIDLAAEHGGHSIYFTPGRTTGASWRDVLKIFSEAVAPTVAHAKSCSVLAAIEPSLRTSVSFVNTLRDAIDVAELTGISMIADFGNMWMERDFREVLAAAMPHIALMQIGDVVIGAPGRPPPGGRAHIGKGSSMPVIRVCSTSKWSGRR